MEYRKLGKSTLEVSAVGLGTWVCGGWMWGGAQDCESKAAIETSIQKGITLIDTAPVYGFGRSEEVVGEAVKKLGARDKVILATKCGLEWSDAQGKIQIRRNSSKKRILQELDDSRRRLQSDVIDLYQIHWPDESVPFEQTMELLHGFYEKGIIRAIGVSNFNVEQMKQTMTAGPLHSLQPPYNLFEREIEETILPFCREQEIAVLGYGSICRGLLSGKFTSEVSFGEGDVRLLDPKFRPENLGQYLKAVERLKEMAAQKKATSAQLAIRWAATQPGMTSALVGARRAEQALDNVGAYAFEFTPEDVKKMEAIVSEEITSPAPMEFTGPPRNLPAKSSN